MSAGQEPPTGHEPTGEPPAQGQNYPPQGGGGGYPPQNYPPPGQGYPPQNYPPPGQGYPPQGQGGYPPQGQGGYPPQGQGGYPPQGQGYPPQGGYPGGPQGYPPQSQPPGGFGPNPLASIGARIGAALIDLLVLIIPAAILASATGGLDTTNGFEISLTGVPFLVQSLLTVAYFTIMEGMSGATLGKMAVGIKVVKEDHTRIDFGPAAIRNLVRIVDYAICFLPGLITMSASNRRQRLGDMAANTLVVRKEFVRG